jgi:hypothetical protein
MLECEHGDSVFKGFTLLKVEREREKLTGRTSSVFNIDVVQVLSSAH